MTTIKFTCEDDTLRVSFNGHAGYAKDGEPDIVCSACSTLAFTLAQGMRVMEAEGSLIDFCLHHFENGNADIYAKAKRRDDAMIRLQTIGETIYYGLAMLQKKYPNHVKIENYPKIWK